MPQHCDTCIRAGYLVTQDARRTVLKDAGIAVTQGKIQATGSWESIQTQYTARQTLLLENSLVMPGLINSHTHVAMTLFRGLADDLPLMEWLTEHIFPAEQQLTHDMVYYGSLLGCAEMMASGTSCFYDMYLLEGAVARAVDTSGMRARLGEVLFSFPSPAYADWDQACEVVRDLEATYASHERIRTAVMPHAVYTTTAQLWEDSRLLARTLGVPLHTHLAESPGETQQCLSLHGKRPVEWLASSGILDETLCAAHCVDLSDEEIALLARAGVRVVHNPKSNMKLASGSARIPELLRAGVACALGTDGACSNNALNMFAEMSTCALQHKLITQDPTSLPAQQVLDMATRHGAACLDWPELGSIAAGQAADIIALRLDAPNLIPLHTPVSQLVYAANGSEVHMTMINGTIVYENGTFTQFDYPALCSEIQKIQAQTR